MPADELYPPEAPPDGGAFPVARPGVTVVASYSVVSDGHVVTFDVRLIERSWCESCASSSRVRVRVSALCSHGVTQLGERLWCLDREHARRSSV